MLRASQEKRKREKKGKKKEIREIEGRRKKALKEYRSRRRAGHRVKNKDTRTSDLLNATVRAADGT
jgi:hypothetical protein